MVDPFNYSTVVPKTEVIPMDQLVFIIPEIVLLGGGSIIFVVARKMWPRYKAASIGLALLGLVAVITSIIHFYINIYLHLI